jgi:hypothetical protein
LAKAQEELDKMVAMRLEAAAVSKDLVALKSLLEQYETMKTGFIFGSFHPFFDDF